MNLAETSPVDTHSKQETHSAPQNTGNIYTVMWWCCQCFMVKLYRSYVGSIQWWTADLVKNFSRSDQLMNNTNTSVDKDAESCLVLIYTYYILLKCTGKTLLKKNNFGCLTLLWPWLCLDQFQNLIICSLRWSFHIKPINIEHWDTTLTRTSDRCTDKPKTQLRLHKNMNHHRSSFAAKHMHLYK